MTMIFRTFVIALIFGMIIVISIQEDDIDELRSDVFWNEDVIKDGLAKHHIKLDALENMAKMNDFRLDELEAEYFGVDRDN